MTIHALSNFSSQGSAIKAPLARLRHILTEITAQAVDNAFGEILLLCVRIKCPFFLRIGNKAQFKKSCRHNRVQKNVEVGRMNTAITEVRSLHVFPVQGRSKLQSFFRTRTVVGRYTARFSLIACVDVNGDEDVGSSNIGHVAPCLQFFNGTCMRPYTSTSAVRVMTTVAP